MTQSRNPYRIGQRRNEWVRLRTFVNLRWLAIGGQTLAVLLASSVLALDLRLGLCALLIGASAALNITITLVSPATKRLRDRGAMLSLLFDLGQLAALLYLTGGLHNPFAVLMLAPTVVSATVLSLRATITVGIASLVCITLLARFHLPLITDGGAMIAMPAILIVGIWAALTVSVVFLGGYARRVAVETYAMSDALAATQLALERQQRLTSLGGVVAATAHELGTPLATIKLVSTELEAELAGRPDLQADAALIRTQTERCRDILRAMGKRGKDDLLVQSGPILAIVQEAVEPHLDRGKHVTIRVNGHDADTFTGEQPIIARQSGIIHGLRNLMQNAVDFATNSVQIDIDWTARDIRIVIADDGPGFPPELLDRVGDPFLRRRDAPAGTHTERPEYEGMGLGLFIAKTLLERSAARLSVANGPVTTDAAGPPGAVVSLHWPRSALEVPATEVRQALGDNKTVAG